VCIQLYAGREKSERDVAKIFLILEIFVCNIFASRARDEKKKSENSDIFSLVVFDIFKCKDPARGEVKVFLLLKGKIESHAKDNFFKNSDLIS
jgi:hypothetical protein